MKSFLDDAEWRKSWQQKWKGMPAYEMSDKTAYKQVLVSFRNIKDFEDFERLIGQKMTRKTKSIWFPKSEIDHVMEHAWVDESDIPEDKEETHDKEEAQTGGDE